VQREKTVGEFNVDLLFEDGTGHADEPPLSLQRRSGHLPASELFGQGTVKLPPHLVWQRRWLRVAVHFNRLPRRIHNETAVLTVLEVSRELLGQNRIQFAVQVFRQLPNYLFAGQGLILA
jgi:hypothetical protein